MGQCKNCGTKFIGRLDKKYCSDLCRSDYNNKLNRVKNKYIYDVNKILKKNREILKLLTPDGKSTVHKDMLIKQGFRFDYFTNVYKTRAGKEYFFCYEYGYLPLERDFYVLVKKDLERNEGAKG